MRELWSKRLLGGEGTDPGLRVICEMGCFTGEEGCVRSSAWEATAPAGQCPETILCCVWCQTERLVGKLEGECKAGNGGGGTENGALTLPHISGQAEARVSCFLSPV